VAASFSRMHAFSSENFTTIIQSSALNSLLLQQLLNNLVVQNLKKKEEEIGGNYLRNANLEIRGR